MREILFKALRKDYKDLPQEEWWVEGDLRQDKDLKTAFINGWEYSYSETGIEREPFEYEVIPETVCQYIGLKDKESVKIFENDILEDGDGTQMIVSWNTPYAGWCLRKSGWAYDHFFKEACNAEDVKVIGNVIDSPKALEEGEK